MKNFGRDKLIIGGFLIIILMEITVHYHEENVISIIQTKERLKKRF